MIDISKVTADGPHIGSFRTTKYELRFLHVGPNGVGVECTERGVVGSAPIRLEIDEDVFSAEQIAAIKATFSLIEEAFRIGHDAKEEALSLAGIAVPRAEVHKLVRQAEEAKAAAKAAAAEKARHEEETEKARDLAEVERKRVEIEAEAKRQELAELEAQLVERRSVLASNDGNTG